MAGPYCGKDCESCALREQLSLFRVPVRTWPNLGHRVRIGKVLPAKRA